MAVELKGSALRVALRIGDAWGDVVGVVSLDSAEATETGVDSWTRIDPLELRWPGHHAKLHEMPGMARGIAGV